MPVQARWPEHVILRSSIIYGRGSLMEVARPLFLQFVAQRLAEGVPTQFFTDEFRSPVYVKDIVAVVLKLLAEPPLELPRRCACHPLPSAKMDLQIYCNP